MILILRKKEWEILKILWKNRNQYTSSQEMAMLIGASDKTIRKYTNFLKSSLKGHGAEIQAKQGNGYQLVITQPVIFAEFREQETKKHADYKIATNVDDNSDRKKYIINKLFLESVILKRNEIEKDLHISSTVVFKLIADIRSLLAEYDISVVNTKKGLEIRGSELKQRQFLVDYFFSRKFNSSFMINLQNTVFDSSINLGEITVIVLDEIRNADLYVSDFVIENLIVHIALMVQRLRNGNTLMRHLLDDLDKQGKNYQVAKNIYDRLVRSFPDIRIPEVEAEYISIHLISRNNKKLSIKNTEVDKEIKTAINNFSELVNGRIQNDSILYKGLVDHFNQLLIRLQNQIEISNPVLRDVEKYYSEELAITKKSFQSIADILDYPINDNEWSYVTLHMIAAMERYSNSQKIRVLIMCATGVGSAQVMKNRLEREFGNALSISKVISYYELDEKVLNEVDLVISSINVDGLYLPVPVINVSVIINDSDIKNIKKFVNIKTDNKRKLSNSDHKYEHIQNEYVFYNCFSEDRFIVTHKENINKEKMLSHMIALLEDNPQTNFNEMFLREIKIRETYGPIIFNNILAIPHPTKPLTKDEKIVVAIIKKGLYWDSENPNIRFIFLLSPSITNNKNMRQVSNSLAKIIENKSLEDELLNINNYNDFKNIMLKILSL
ncbi:BglG family transcription antiterminator [Aerococcus urinae]